MSTVEEIKEAIQTLSPEDREELVACLPTLLPELDGDAAWERIIRDPRPRPALSALLDQAEAEYRRDPSACPETSESEFDRQSWLPTAHRPFGDSTGDCRATFERPPV
jgi:hypothetical protein